MLVIGIDTGKSGAAVKVDSVTMRIETYVLPINNEGDWDPQLMMRLAGRWMLESVDLVVIEATHAFPGRGGDNKAAGGASTNFGMGFGYGMWLGCLAHLRVEKVHSMTWRKELGIKTVPGRNAQEARALRKQQSLERARMLYRFPFKTSRGRDLDGEAEASLIALWGIQKLKLEDKQEELNLNG